LQNKYELTDTVDRCNASSEGPKTFECFNYVVPTIWQICVENVCYTYSI